MKKVTIAMVAERAGVSRGTVDRVLNQRPHVSPDQYEKVMAAIRDLNYIPVKARHQAVIGAGQDTAVPMTLGVIYSSEGGYIRREMRRGFRDAMETLKSENIELVTEICDTRMPDELNEYILNMKKKGVKGIALRAEHDPMITEAINELADEGIPVVTYNSDLPNSQRAAFVGQDPFQSGRVAGSLMAKLLQPGDGLIAAIGNLKVYGHQQRLQGFSDVMYSHGFRGKRMHVIETYNDYYLTAQRISEVLQENEGIKGIYMANRSMVGCIEAVRRAGLSGKIRVIGHDVSESTRQIRQLLRSEEVDFVITENIYLECYHALLTLQKLAAGESIPRREIILTDIPILCAENLSDSMEE